MVKEKGMQFFIIDMKMKRKRDKKIDLPQRGFEPPNSRQKFEFWGRSDKSSSRFLKLLNFIHPRRKRKYIYLVKNPINTGCCFILTWGTTYNARDMFIHFHSYTVCAAKHEDTQTRDFLTSPTNPFDDVILEWSLIKTCFCSWHCSRWWFSHLFSGGSLVVCQSRVHISSDSLFSKILKKPSIVQKKMIHHMNGLLVFFEMKQKKIFFLKKKFQNGRLKKRSFFKIANSQYFFVKISYIGPWVSRIEWCEGHWSGSTYMVVRLADISSKTVKKCIFGVFWPFLSLCWTASRPHRFSHLNALRIIQSY